jgi:hypothetical protein
MNQAFFVRRLALPAGFKVMAASTLAFIAGAGAMLVAYPFVFAPPPAADAAPVALVQAAPVAPLATAAPVAASGPVFRFDENAPGRDPIHWANGTGRFVLTAEGWVLRLDGNFRAGAGPNFWLYLNTTAVGEEDAFRADRGRIKLAPLRAFAGAQNYRLPAGLDPSQFHTLTIWCETFGVYIASGALTPPAQG